DNAPPGLGFSSGNIVGISELDVESVELINGASSALYGPGGLNGVILMTSKSPFEYQGLSVGLRMGLMHVGADYQDSPDPMYDFNLRYAKSFNDKFAFKVNFSYLTANDWQANDLRDNNNLNDPSLTRLTNEGYDGVNTYGDEAFLPTDIADFAEVTGQGTALAEGLQPGTPEFDARAAQIAALFPESQFVTRDGYLESDLADYNTSSFKSNLSLHYRITENVELIASGGYNRGTAVYTASSRFSLVDFALYNAKLEVRGPKFFLRAWTTGENAGDTYDIGGVALQMNESWKGTEQWYTDYINGFVTSRLLGNSLDQAYTFGRSLANNRDANGNILNPNLPFRPLPGDPEFETLVNQIRSQPISGQVETSVNTVSGAGVTDFS
ncbi:MAG: TonB-dependent receptor, partial [Bacteroidota bacterium]